MAKEEIGGVWRTVGGRRIFIKDGEDLETAMKNSGKFKNNKKSEKINETMNKRSEIINKLDKETNDLSDYDKYNLAISKLEENDYDTPTERQYWIGVKQRYEKNQNETTSYDPHKGTKFERKYDSVKEALDDPNGAFQEYLRKKEQPEAVKFENMLERHNVRTFADDIELQEMSKMTNKELVEFEKSKGGFKTSDNAEFARAKELYYETGLAKYKDKMDEILKKHNIR